MYNETFPFKDAQTECAEILHYILMSICKKNKTWKIIGQDNDWDYSVRTRYNEVHFEHIKWIVDRANFMSNRLFGLSVIPSMYIHMHNEDHFVPESFRHCNNHELTYYMAGADIYCLNRIIRRWKIYGKHIVNFHIFLYGLKYKFLYKNKRS